MMAGHVLLCHCQLYTENYFCSGKDLLGFLTPFFHFCLSNTLVGLIFAHHHFTIFALRRIKHGRSTYV